MTLPFTVIRERQDGRNYIKWYTPPRWRRAARLLLDAAALSRPPDPNNSWSAKDIKRIIALLAGPEDELDRELVVAALAGDAE